MDIAVVIPTLNEEHNIRNTINMMPDLVDEIIVVDSGSKDRSQAICEDMGVQFYFGDFWRVDLLCTLLQLRQLGAQ